MLTERKEVLMRECSREKAREREQYRWQNMNKEKLTGEKNSMHVVD